MAPVAAKGIKFVGHSDMGGRGDGVQVMVHRGYAYVGHGYSNGNFDVFWEGGRRYGVPGTISTNALTLDSKTQPDEYTELLFKRFSRHARPTPSSRSRRCPAPCRSA